MTRELTQAILKLLPDNNGAICLNCGGFAKARYAGNTMRVFIRALGLSKHVAIQQGDTYIIPYMKGAYGRGHRFNAAGLMQLDYAEADKETGGQTILARVAQDKINTDQRVVYSRQLLAAGLITQEELDKTIATVQAELDTE